MRRPIRRAGVKLRPCLSRAARGLLGWSQADLAEAAAIGVSTIKNYESGLRDTTESNQNAIRHALEDGGVEFIAAKGGKGVGVRLRAG